MMPLVDAVSVWPTCAVPEIDGWPVAAVLVVVVPMPLTAMLNGVSQFDQVVPVTLCLRLSAMLHPVKAVVSGLLPAPRLRLGPVPSGFSTTTK